MDVPKRTMERLKELIKAGRGIGETDAGSFRRWLTSTRNLMANFVGRDTPHFEDFNDVYGDMELAELDLYDEAARIQQIVGILEATRDDIAAGFMFKRDLLISAGNFADILGQAGHLLSKQYKDAAAVLAGAVLESALRKLCDTRGLSYTPKETMEPLNVKLAKDGAYQAMTQKMITTWGDLRNNAAHGHFDRYTEAEVRQMHQWVSGFLEQQLR